MSIDGLGSRHVVPRSIESGGRPAVLKDTATATEPPLRRAAAQFEAVFVQQMLAAMRATIPEGALIDAGQAEDLFASMLDQHMAEMMTSQGERGLADAIYRQLNRGIEP